MKRILVSITTAALVGLGGMGALHGAAHAQGGTPVSCGDTITAPGEYYLASDCAGGSPNGITIASSHVHLKLDGHTMSRGDGAGIDACCGLTDVRIEGPGVIDGYQDGIDLEDSSNSHVWKVTATDTDRSGFHDGGTSNQWNDDTATDGGGGFDIAGVGDHLVNDVADGNFDGIILEPGASGTHVDASDARDNGPHGIWVVTGAMGNALHGNTAYGNRIDLEDDNPNCDSNVWAGNHFGTTNQPQCVS